MTRSSNSRRSSSSQSSSAGISRKRASVTARGVGRSCARRRTRPVARRDRRRVWPCGEPSSCARHRRDEGLDQGNPPPHPPAPCIRLRFVLEHSSPSRLRHDLLPGGCGALAPNPDELRGDVPSGRLLVSPDNGTDPTGAPPAASPARARAGRELPHERGTCLHELAVRGHRSWSRTCAAPHCSERRRANAWHRSLPTLVGGRPLVEREDALVLSSPLSGTRLYPRTPGWRLGPDRLRRTAHAR